MTAAQIALALGPIGLAAVGLSAWAVVHRGPRPRHQHTRRARGLELRRKS